MLGLWGKPQDPPALAVAYILEAIVKAIGLALPKLDGARHYAEASPEGRERYFAVDELALHLVQLHFERLARTEHLGLMGNPSSELAAAWAGHEVLRGFDVRDALGDPIDFDLPFQLWPPEQKGHSFVAFYVHGLAALEIGEKNESLTIEDLQEHHPNRWRPVAVDGRQRHGIGLEVDAFAGFFEPLLELRDRVGVEMLPFEGAADVLPARLIDGAVVSHEGPATRFEWRDEAQRGSALAGYGAAPA